MNRKMVASIGVVSFLLLTSVSVVYIQEAKAEGPSDEWIKRQVITTSGDLGVSEVRIPSVCVTPNGTWLYAYENRSTDGDLGEIDINLHISYDNGTTWSSGVWFEDIPGGHPDGCSLCNPTFTVDRYRDRVYFFVTERTSREGMMYLFFRYSDDDGSTWSSWTNISDLKPDDIVNDDGAARTSGRGVVLENGTVLIPMTGVITSSFCYPYTIRSYDGVNFHLASDLFCSRSYECNENNYALCSNGSVLCMARKAGTYLDQGGFLKFYSDDNGSTWNYMGNDFPLVGCCRGCLMTLSTEDNSDAHRILMAFTNSSSRDDVTIAVSYDDGVTWSDSREVDPAESWGSYAQIAMTSNFSIVCAYETEEYDELKLAQMNLEWITEGNDWVEEVESDTLNITAINNQANNTEIIPRYRTFNWTKVDNAGTYSIRIGNSTDATGNVTDVFLQLDNITVNSANCTNSFLNTSNSASPYAYNYWENSTHCFFYVPYSYNVSYTGEHNYQVRALTKV
jgi:sialidase-1